ncbi:linker for activation of T-cells family member 1 isoform X1 [Hylobates moloch]|uniref:linker for activation of T-cells family member 1 isoform X1 n=1 Tax=Hylobates moloch TaxID=81572 RepID=UPI0013642D9D|nr:linker for activation of T-cells family member 1 isoform X1 [Hylobates moloch]
MEEAILVPCVLGLLLLPILAMLMALCVHCHRLPGSYDSASSDSLYPRGIQIKRPHTVAPWPPAYPPATSYLPLSQPDLLPIPRSPQPLGGSHRTPSSRRDSDGANSVASYENEEPACEDADEDEDEDDYHNPGYLVVLPDSTPAASTAAPSAPALSTPGIRDSAFSTLLCDRPYFTEEKTEAQRVESIDDYVNVPESGESAEASLDGSREYVNVSQELHPGAAKTEPAALSSQEAEEVEEEGAPDYENLQELN